MPCSEWYVVPRTEQCPDPKFVASITSDVMRCLDNSCFFEQLDDLMCPKDSSNIPKGCSGDYKLSESILRASGFEVSDFADIFDVLQAKGGFCDCEILYNTSESNRLKSTYWQPKAQGIEPRTKHTSGKSDSHGLRAEVSGDAPQPRSKFAHRPTY